MTKEKKTRKLTLRISQTTYENLVRNVEILDKRNITEFIEYCSKLKFKKIPLNTNTLFAI
jgi:hypothetical protein